MSLVPMPFAGRNLIGSRTFEFRGALFLAGALLGHTWTTPAFAGGGWVTERGQSTLQLGFSRKVAESAWTPTGTVRENLTRHDFRYGYASGEVGLLQNLSATFLLTYLHGIEGEEINKGLSDAWFGARYQVVRGDWPVAASLTMRTAALYDLEGPYDRHLFMEGDEVTVDGEDVPLAEFRGVSPEWRGLLREDYTLAAAVSRNLWSRGWGTLETGYTFRSGAPADQVPVSIDVGVPLSFLHSTIKATTLFVRSVGNDHTRNTEDRFGASATNNFNDASMLRVGGSLLFPLGASGVSLEVGDNHWVWGRSARRYNEPFVAMSFMVH